MQGANTIDFHVLVEKKYIQIELSNFHYLFILDTNLISFEILKEKRYEFHTINGFLQIKDKEDIIVMESFKNNSIYSLW